MDDTSLKDAMYAAMAKTVLDSLDTEIRDAILSKSIKEVLGEYRCKDAISKAITEKATRIAAELAESESWEAQIVKAIEEGFEEYLANLKQAIPNLLQSALNGEESDSHLQQRAGLIVRRMVKKS